MKKMNGYAKYVLRPKRPQAGKGNKMNDLEILESQIRRQIEGRIDIKVYFPDCKPDFISLYDQNHGYFIEPAAKPAKKITEIQYDELMSQVKNGEIKTNLQYDWFFT